jgi:hypothetical protein
MAAIHLPLDTTGKAAANKIVGESHTLVNRAIRIAVAEYGAFYADTLEVKDTTSGQLLTKTQYRAGEMLVEETAQYGRRICTVVLVTDPAVSNNITIGYQALGDWNNYSKAALNQELLTLGDGTTGIDWDSIVDKPLRFNPAPHLHHVSEVYGAEYLENSLYRVRDAASLGEHLLRSRMVDYINTTVGAAVDKVDSTTASLLAIHKADSNAHPQYAKSADLVPTLAVVRKPQGVTPAPNDQNVKLETVFRGSAYYSLYGVAQKAAQFHIATKSDFSDIRLLETITGAVQEFQQDGLLAGSKTHFWRVRYQDVDNVWSDWSDGVLFVTMPDYPKKGTILSTYCVGIEQWGKIADGRNGFTDQLLNAKSVDCGYIPPEPAGTVKAEFCKGVDMWRTYADGNYGTYDAVYQKNSLTCGYVPPPAEGTVLKEYCVGLNLMRDIANGAGGYNTILFKANSTTCGYVPPIPEGTELRRYCEELTYTLHVIYADGNYGEKDVIKEYNSTECGYVPPPAAGTVLGEYCKGTTKYHRIANGDGTDHEQLVEQNSTFCGYSPIIYPAAGEIIGYQCQGYDKYNKVADGKGSFTLALAQRNAQVCGYSPPAAGTVLAEFCKAKDLWRTYADGNDGSYDQLYQAKSGTCGYIAPTLAKPTWASPQDQIIVNPTAGVGGTLNDMVVNNDDGAVSYKQIEWNVYNSSGALVHSGSNTNGSFTTKNYAYIPQGVWANNSSYTIYARFVSNGAGTSDWSVALRISVRYEEFTPYGTWLGEKCIGFDKYNVRANGTGGTYDELVERNASFCGFVNPIDPGFDSISNHFGAFGNGIPASFSLTLASGGNWSTTIRFGTTNSSGRYLTSNAAGWEIMFESDPYGGNVGGYSPSISTGAADGQWASLANGCNIGIADSDSFNDGEGLSGTFRFTIRHQGMGVSRSKEITYDVDGGCFAVGTAIRTPDGDVCVEALAVSDIITSFAEPTMPDSTQPGWLGWTTGDTSKVTVNEMSLVVNNRRFVAEQSIKLNGLHSTLSHIHFVYSQATHTYGWKKARDVVMGDAFIDSDRNLIPIISIERIDTPYTFVALDVEDIDTLQVKLGDRYILTHNLS